MAIFEGSRYILGENSKKITATKVVKNGNTLTYLHTRKIYTLKDMRKPTGIHEAQVTDLLDLLGYRNAGSESRWFLIADINGMFYPDDEVDKGRILLIPDLEDFQRV